MHKELASMHIMTEFFLVLGIVMVLLGIGTTAGKMALVVVDKGRGKSRQLRYVGLTLTTSGSLLIAVLQKVAGLSLSGLSVSIGLPSFSLWGLITFGLVMLLLSWPDVFTYPDLTRSRSNQDF